MGLVAGADAKAIAVVVAAMAAPLLLPRGLPSRPLECSTSSPLAGPVMQLSSLP